MGGHSRGCWPLSETTHVPRAISFTLDLEDYALCGTTAPLDRSVDAILAAAAAAGARGTVFVVGELAERRPDLVARCHDAGHEIGLHGYRHVPIDQLGPAGLRDDVLRGRDVVESITGERILGYRAPLFSITPATSWAPAILAEIGIRYSSSVLPAANPIRGFPGAPRGAFRWKSGLVEFPCPVGGVGRMRIPFLGGVYLRYLPMTLVRHLAKRSPVDPQWLYCHPYDVDETGIALALPHAGRATTWVLGRRRRGCAHRITQVLSLGSAGSPLGEIAAAIGELAEFPRPVA